MYTEKSREYRKLLKSSDNKERLENYKAKQNEAYRRYTERQKQDDKKAQIFKRNARDRKRKSREKLSKKKQPKTNLTSSVFSSASTRSKAVVKLISSLPNRIEEKCEVLDICCKRFKVNHDSNAAIPPIVQKKRNGFVEIEKAARDFFSIDLISKLLPGIRDFVTMESPNGEKVQVQKRVLLMSLADVYKEFTQSFPNLKISFSKFCKLRPKNVFLFSTTLHYSCLCIHCENFKLLLNGLSCFLLDPKMSLDGLLANILCDVQNFNCVSGICDECKDSETLIKRLLNSCCLDEGTKYKEWRKNDGYIQKVAVEGVLVRDILNIILANIKDFKMHRYLMKVQRGFFSNIKLTQNDDTVTIVVDFSENFATKAQYEIQSSYFGRKQISLFTAVAWIGQSTERSFVIASDNIRHSKEQVAVYMCRIFLKLKYDYPQLLHAKVFSDGAGSQFKNHFIMSNLLFGMADYGLNLEWNFFATSHGKSSADGLGGTIKRGVYYRMLTDQWDIYSAKDFVDCALSFVKNINIFEVSQNEINEEIKQFSDRWKQSKNMPGMQSRHFFKPSIKENYISMAKSSIGDDLTDLKIF